MMSQYAATDIGPPHFWDKMPKMCQDNYFQWQYHEKVKPGVLKHVGPAGALYTVRVGSTRLLSTETIRWFAALADKYCDGHLRFTTRTSIEFMTTEEENVDKIIEEVGYTATALLPTLPVLLRLLWMPSMTTSSAMTCQLT